MRVAGRASAPISLQSFDQLASLAASVGPCVPRRDSKEDKVSEDVAPVAVELGLQFSGFTSDLLLVFCSNPVVGAVAGPICPVAGSIGIGIGAVTLAKGLRHGEGELVAKGLTSCVLGSISVGFCIAATFCPPLIAVALSAAAGEMFYTVYIENWSEEQGACAGDAEQQDPGVSAAEQLHLDA